MDINKICAGCMNINEDGGKCPVCGCESDYENFADQLPVRYVLSGRYIIGKSVLVTCESIIYVAYDNANGKTVNVKEYFPDHIAKRMADNSVAPCYPENPAYENGIVMFKELNEKLQFIDLPALPKTHTVFSANNTVYVVTDVITGITLKDFVNRNEGRLKWEQARPLFLPLIDTVDELNKRGIVHGGISPESIFINRDGRLRIRDILINSARKANGDMSAQIYGGYAAVEQYKPELAVLGGYTDVYGMAATLFRVLIGNVPADAVSRMEKDTLSIPSHFAEELPRQVLVAMANALQVMPEDRTESVEKFRDEIVYGEIDSGFSASQGSETPKKKNKSKEQISSSSKAAVKERSENGVNTKPQKNGNVKTALITAGCTVALFLIVGAVIFFNKDKIFDNKNKNSSSVPSESEMSSFQQIGEYDSELVNSTATFTVPDITGLTFAQITERDSNSHFVFKIEGKKYSDKYAKGTVCEQSSDPGSEVEEGTVIMVSISLGPQEYEISDVVGLTELEAKVQLLRQGLLYGNIEVVEKYDSDKKPGVVLEQSPSGGSRINDETRVRIYVNSYDGD